MRHRQIRDFEYGCYPTKAPLVEGCRASAYPREEINIQPRLLSLVNNETYKIISGMLEMICIGGRDEVSNVLSYATSLVIGR